MRVTRDLVDVARAEAELMHRSVSQQIEHWALVGRALEQSAGVSLQRVRDCLAGVVSLDQLDVEERAFALAEYERKLTQLDTTALEAELEARPRYVSDGAGGVVEVSPAGRRRVRGTAVLATALAERAGRAVPSKPERRKARRKRA